MRAHVFATEQEARRLLAAIDAVRGPTEVLREVRVVRGRLEVLSERVVPTKPWGDPVRLDDGRWAVPHNRKLAPLVGAEMVVGGVRVRVPAESEAAEIERVEDASGEHVGYRERTKPARGGERNG